MSARPGKVRKLVAAKRNGGQHPPVHNISDTSCRPLPSQPTVFGSSFQKLHTHGQDLWSACGASLFIAHRSQGRVSLTASNAVKRAILSAQQDGNGGLRRLWGPGGGRPCPLDWNKERAGGLLPEQRARTSRWGSGGAALVGKAKEAWEKRGADEGAAYLVYGMCGTKEICAASNEGEQLMNDIW